MIQKYFFHNKANYNSKETKITSMTKKSHRAPTCAELGPAQPQLVFTNPIIPVVGYIQRRHETSFRFVDKPYNVFFIWTTYVSYVISY